MAGDKKLMIITMYDEQGRSINVELPTEDYDHDELRGAQLEQFEQAISDIACTTVDITLNPNHTPFGAKC